MILPITRRSRPSRRPGASIREWSRRSTAWSTAGWTGSGCTTRTGLSGRSASPSSPSTSARSERSCASANASECGRSAKRRGKTASRSTGTNRCVPPERCFPRKPVGRKAADGGACANTPENRCGRGNVDPRSRTGVVPPQKCASEDTRQAGHPWKSAPFLLDTNYQCTTQHLRGYPVWKCRTGCHVSGCHMQRKNRRDSRLAREKRFFLQSFVAYSLYIH